MGAGASNPVLLCFYCGSEPNASVLYKKNATVPNNKGSPLWRRSLWKTVAFLPLGVTTGQCVPMWVSPQMDQLPQRQTALWESQGAGN